VVEVPTSTVSVHSERIVEVPVEKKVQRNKYVETPVEKVVHRDVVVETPVERIVYRDKFVEVPVPKVRRTDSAARLGASRPLLRSRSAESGALGVGCPFTLSSSFMLCALLFEQRIQVHHHNKLNRRCAGGEGEQDRGGPRG
jgi:hypothetical protein